MIFNNIYTDVKLNTKIKINIAKTIKKNNGQTAQHYRK